MSVKWGNTMRYKSQGSIILLLFACSLLAACMGSSAENPTPTVPGIREDNATTTNALQASTIANVSQTPVTGGLQTPATAGNSQIPATSTSAKEQCPSAVSLALPEVSMEVSKEAKNILRQTDAVTITYYGDSVGCGSKLDLLLTNKFTTTTGIMVNVIPKPGDATAAYATYDALFQSRSPDVDVMMLDIIWSQAFAQHLEDLGSYRILDSVSGKQITKESSTVDRKLIAMPLFRDVGVLYYRKDLIKPDELDQIKTWDGFEKVAKRIQAEQRKGNSAFWGFVWQGAAYEGLTCNALEWLYSHGGYNTQGGVQFNSKETRKALNRARRWIKGAEPISPAGVTRYKEDNTLKVFADGNAAFMRHWPNAYMYMIGNGKLNPDQVGVAQLPRDEGQPSVGILGGAQLGISVYSSNEQKKRAAAAFIAYMTDADVQAWRAQVGSYYPTIQSKEVVNTPQGKVTLKTVLDKTMPAEMQIFVQAPILRPTNPAGVDYNAVSVAFFQGVHQYLELNRQQEPTDAEQDQELNQILKLIEQRMRRVCTSPSCPQLFSQ